MDGIFNDPKANKGSKEKEIAGLSGRGGKNEKTMEELKALAKEY